jgi:hypothetical protein
MKNVLKKILLAAVALLLPLLLVEIALRVVYAIDRTRGGDLQQRLERSRKASLADANGDFNMTGLVQASRFKDIVYEAKPNLQGTFRGRDMRLNSHGMRGPEIPVAKPPDTYRIAVLGDSIAFGWGVGQEEVFSAVLERRLNELPPPHPRYEVLNFALPGYNTAIEVATFEHKALAFGPDAAVLQFVGNDTGVPLFMERPQAAFSLARSHLVDLVRSSLGRGEDRLVGNQMANLDRDERRRVISGYEHMVGESGVRRALARLAGLTKPRGIAVFIMKGSCSPKQSALLDKAAQEHGFVAYDLRPYTDDYVRTHGITNTPQARRQLLNVAPGDDHPNAIGHSICAESVMDRMARQSIIRRPAPDASTAQPGPRPAGPVNPPAP